MLVSVTVPSRGRFNRLLTSLETLKDNADDFRRVEVIVRFDYDDYTSLSRLSELKDFNARVIVGPRMRGYADLHNYVGECARLSVGKWLLLWNDDVVMLDGKGWDSKLAAVEYDTCMVTFNKDWGWMFPVITRDIFDVMGHVAERPYYDVWLGEVLAINGNVVPFVYLEDVHIKHLWPKEGQPGDKTFQERQPVVNFSLEEQKTPEIRAMILRDHNKMKEYMNGRQGKT